MFKARDHIAPVKRIALIWFILFAFTPCALKAVIFGAVDAELVRTLNKNKVAAFVNYCQYVTEDRVQAGAEHAPVKDIYHRIVEGLAGRRTDVYTIKVCGTCLNPPTGNSPPKYILFKRWKLDVV